MRRALVTGATGFVGRHVLAALEEVSDVEVVAACRDRRKLPRGFRGEVREGDLLDPDYRRDVVRGVDVVLNAFAWTSLWGQSEEDRRRFLEPTLGLVDAAHGAGVRRFVIASSTAVAAPERSKDPQSSGIPRAFWPHLTHLVAIENALRDRASDGFQAVTLRLGLFAGPGLSVGLLPILLPRLRTRLVPWVDGGRTRLPIVDGRDIGAAFAAAAVAEGLSRYEAVNVVGPSSPTAREVIEFLSVEAAVPQPAFGVSFPIAYRFARVMEALDPIVPWPPLVTRSIVHLLEETGADNERAEQILGYRPKHDWKTALRSELSAQRRSRSCGSDRGSLAIGDAHHSA
jgi:nucleoside-diphosphate-sugar epimerase